MPDRAPDFTNPARPFKGAASSHTQKRTRCRAVTLVHQALVSGTGPPTGLHRVPGASESAASSWYRTPACPNQSHFDPVRSPAHSGHLRVGRDPPPGRCARDTRQIGESIAIRISAAPSAREPKWSRSHTSGSPSPSTSTTGTAGPIPSPRSARGMDLNDQPRPKGGERHGSPVSR